jgi:membrane protein
VDQLLRHDLDHSHPQPGYDPAESRPWWHRRLLAIGLTVALATFALAAFTLVVGGAQMGTWVASRIGAGEAFSRIWRVGRWPLAIALVVMAVDIVYQFAPNAWSGWAG